MSLPTEDRCGRKPASMALTAMSAIAISVSISLRTSSSHTVKAFLPRTALQLAWQAEADVWSTHRHERHCNLFEHLVEHILIKHRIARHLPHRRGDPLPKVPKHHGDSVTMACALESATTSSSQATSTSLGSRWPQHSSLSLCVHGERICERTCKCVRHGEHASSSVAYDCCKDDGQEQQAIVHWRKGIRRRLGDALTVCLCVDKAVAIHLCALLCVRVCVCVGVCVCVHRVRCAVQLLTIASGVWPMNTV